MSAQDVQSLDLEIDDVARLVEEALTEHAGGRTVMPAKTELSTSGPWFLHSMPAIVSSMGAGLKWVSYNPTNRTRDLPNSSAVLILNDLESGLPYCILDALWATYARTAACAIVAMRHLANPVRSVGLVGGGQMAEIIVPYIDQTFPTIESFVVLTRSNTSATAFCERMAPALDASIRPALDADDATEGADVVLSAIGGTASPPLGEAQFHTGMLALALDAQNSWTTAALNLADKSFADDVVAFLNGFAHHRPNDQPPEIMTELADVIAGKVEGRQSPSERIFCSNNGIAILDMALGVEIFRRATMRDLGITFPLVGT